MNASVVDLRYRMKNVLKALDRNEEVNILYHGKVKGVIQPKRAKAAQLVREHPFYKMDKSSVTVEDRMAGLRGGRTRDL
jgi:hypothetical protein